MKLLSLRHSFRRDALDFFLENNYHYVRGNVLDIGGQRGLNRGIFDRTKLEKNSRKYTIINPEVKFKPDICCRFEDAKFDSDETFDVIICTETFEYFRNPNAQLAKIDELLNLEGYLFLSIPFLVPPHSDSDADCFRISPIWMEKKMDKMGYRLIQKQGTHMVHSFFDTLRAELHRNPPVYPLYKLLVLLVFILKCIIWIITVFLPPQSSFSGGIWLLQKSSKLKD